jgi:hypothetical protein
MLKERNILINFWVLLNKFNHILGKMMKLDNMKLEMKITKELTEVQEEIDQKVEGTELEEEEEELEDNKVQQELKHQLINHNKSQLFDLNI